MNWFTKLIFIQLLAGFSVTSFALEPTWCRSKIDRFVQARHAEQKMAPAKEAARSTLIRRLSLDVLGLPPTLPEIDAFVNDQRPDAYERLVDRLLASPRFGERMAQFWLDLARYADSDGYHDDTNRAMWPYRDWVINAFNDNMPFDQFTIEQLAGDMLPNPTVNQLVATAFHRNGPTSSEDGANPDEYRARYAVDRVNTTAQVWLGLTVACAECHDHKYDPISTKEYYQLFAFFNQTPEEPLFRGLYAPPSIPVPNEAQQEELARLASGLERKQRQLRNAQNNLADHYEAWRAEMTSLARDDVERTSIISEFLFNGIAEQYLQNTGARRKAAKIRKSQSGEAPSVIRGLVDGAIQFSGRGDSLDLGQLVEFRRSLGFTIEAWLKFDHPGGPVISKLDSENGSRGFELSIIGGRVVVRLVDQWPDSAIQVSTVARHAENQWMHLTVTYDGSSRSDGIHVYVNGEPQDLSVDLEAPIRTIRNRSPLIAGANSENQSSFKGVIDELRFYKWPLTARQLNQAPLPKLHAVAKQDDLESRGFLQHYFGNYVHRLCVELGREIATLSRQKELFEQHIPRIRVMQDRKQHRTTHVLNRGDFRDLGEIVRPNTPSMLPEMPRKTGKKEYSRLDLARWIVGANHAQTAKVYANRIWALIFGRGLVASLDDFGTRGDPASHPFLLDWMAIELVRTSWDVKSLLRQVVLSATYRQSSATNIAAWDNDPANEQLARGPRKRLSAEALRDNVLQISGLLSNRIGGPSVRPYQPPGLWREMSKGDEQEKTYIQSHGDDLYRRGIYTFWKRSIHYPAFAVLDAPNRETCTSSRPTTNTPVQALALLNDPTYVEAARAFAARIIKSNIELDERIDFAFRLATARTPASHEHAKLRDLYHDLRADYEFNSASVDQLLTVGELAIDEEIDRVELATWTALGQVILTLDEVLTKE